MVYWPDMTAQYNIRDYQICKKYQENKVINDALIKDKPGTGQRLEYIYATLKIEYYYLPHTMLI